MRSQCAQRTIVFAALAAIALAAPVRAQDDDKTEEAKKLLEDGITQLQAKRYDESIATYKKVIDLATKKEIDEAAEQQVLQLAHYNIACAYSLKGEKGPALDHFEKALDAGFDDYAHIEKDSDLDAVRNEPRFKEIIAKRREAERKRLRAEAAKSISSTPLFDFDFELQTLAGDKIKLADFKGKTLVVVFWGTWTSRALAEIPHLMRLRDELGPKGVEVIGVAYELGKTDDGTYKKLRELVERKGIKYPVTLVGKDDPILKKMPEGDQYPSKLFVDKNGKVRAAEVGAQPYEGIEAIVGALMDESGVEKAEAKPTPAPEKKPEEKKPEKKPGEDEPI